MKSASAAKIAAQFEDYLEASREQPVLVTRNGKPVAVLMAVQDRAEAEQLASRRSRSLRSFSRKGTRKFKRAAESLTPVFGGRSRNHAAPSDRHRCGARKPKPRGAALLLGNISHVASAPP